MSFKHTPVNMTIESFVWLDSRAYAFYNKDSHQQKCFIEKLKFELFSQ